MTDEKPKSNPGIAQDPLRGRGITPYPHGGGKNKTGIFKTTAGDNIKRITENKAGPKMRPRKKA